LNNKPVITVSVKSPVQPGKTGELTGDNIEEEPVTNTTEAFVTTSQNASIVVEDIKSTI